MALTLLRRSQWIGEGDCVIINHCVLSLAIIGVEAGGTKGFYTEFCTEIAAGARLCHPCHLWLWLLLVGSWSSGWHCPLHPQMWDLTCF